MKQDDLKMLKNLTKELLIDTKMASDYYLNKIQPSKVSADFHSVVKPFADEMLLKVKQWEPIVLEWIKATNPKYVYPLQIHDTCENLTIISVTAFQKDTRRRRFINTISAVEHVLESVIEQIDESVI